MCLALAGCRRLSFQSGAKEMKGWQPCILQLCPEGLCVRTWMRQTSNDPFQLRLKYLMSEENNITSFYAGHFLPSSANGPLAVAFDSPHEVDVVSLASPIGS